MAFYIRKETMGVSMALAQRLLGRVEELGGLVAMGIASPNQSIREDTIMYPFGAASPL